MQQRLTISTQGEISLAQLETLKENINSLVSLHTVEEPVFKGAYFWPEVNETSIYFLIEELDETENWILKETLEIEISEIQAHISELKSLSLV